MIIYVIARNVSDPVSDTGQAPQSRRCLYFSGLPRLLSKPRNDDIPKLITVGELAKNIATTTKVNSNSFDKNNDAAKYILDNIPEGTTILFKASRSMKFEEIITGLKAKK